MEIVYVAMVTLLCVTAITAKGNGRYGESSCDCGCGPKIRIRTAAKPEMEEKAPRHTIVDYCRWDYLMVMGQCLGIYKKGDVSREVCGNQVTEACASMGGYGITFYFRDQVRRFAKAFKMVHPGIDEIWTSGYWNGSHCLWLGTGRVWAMEDFTWVDGASVTDGECTAVDIMAEKLRPRPCTGYDLKVVCESDVTL